MGLKQEVDVGSKLDPLSRWHGEQSIVVKDRVERLDPLRVDVTITDDPRMDFWRIR